MKYLDIKGIAGSEVKKMIEVYMKLLTLIFQTLFVFLCREMVASQR